MRRRLVLLSVVASTLLVLGACSSSSDTAEVSTTSGGGSSAAVTIENFAFGPSDVSVNVGETITWSNADGVGHTTTSDDDLWASGTVMSGGSFEHTFTTAGEFTYFCSIHPSMTGKVTVSG